MQHIDTKFVSSRQLLEQQSGVQFLPNYVSFIPKNAQIRMSVYQTAGKEKYAQRATNNMITCSARTRTLMKVGRPGSGMRLSGSWYAIVCRERKACCTE